MSAGTGSRSASAWSCRHMSKKVAWMSVPSLTGSMCFSVLPSSRFVFDSCGERAWVLMREAGEKLDGQILGLWLRRVGVLLDPPGHVVGMLRLPGCHVGGVGRIGFDPVLGDGRMGCGPLGDDRRLSVRSVLLEPGFDVGRHQLARVGSAAVFDDRSQLPGDAVAEQVVVAPQFEAPDAAALYETAEGRGWKNSSPVKGWAINREPIGLPGASKIRLPSACDAKQGLATKEQKPG